MNQLFYQCGKDSTSSAWMQHHNKKPLCIPEDLSTSVAPLLPVFPVSPKYLDEYENDGGKREFRSTQEVFSTMSYYNSQQYI